MGRARRSKGTAGGDLGRDLHRRIVDEVRRRAARSPLGHLLEGRLGELDLRLRIDLRHPDAGEEALGSAVETAIAAFVDEAIETAAAFRPGRAFCHRCETADCEHALPPGPRDAFAGYGPTGVPRWVDFAQLCLDQRHPDVDRLYDERRPAILTLETGGAGLKADLLPSFQRSRRRHDLAGQVAAGLFRLAGLPSPVALTFQAVVSRRQRGERRVGLNVLGGGSRLDGALAAIPPEARPWRGAVVWAQARFDEISRRPRLPPAQFDRRVEGVLTGLARRIEHELRGRVRRTKHAEERHLSGRRPTRKAIDDLREADLQSVFTDRRHSTLVVVGERGRTHFFAPGGRLVSSVRYPRETIERKLRVRQWRPATARELAAVRRAMETPDEPESD